jgi:hypothetical protein
MKVDYKYESQKNDWINGVRYKGLWCGFRKRADKEDTDS